ncbi:hypothetical protein [Bradyrhizobium sp. BR 1432]|uniref:hypothetical protein n=1 Tax=Bradyrhizobium sp. BR 1432 TaxID=3447966 RepID=UPI003EE5D10F
MNMIDLLKRIIRRDESAALDPSHRLGAKRIGVNLSFVDVSALIAPQEPVFEARRGWNHVGHRHWCTASGAARVLCCAWREDGRLTVGHGDPRLKTTSKTNRA